MCTRHTHDTVTDSQTRRAQVLGTRAAAEASRSDKDDQEDEHNHNHDSDHNHARGDQAGEGEHQEAHSWVARGSSAGGASVQRDDTAAAEELAQAAHITTPNLTQDGARLFDNDPFQVRHVSHIVTALQAGYRTIIIQEYGRTSLWLS